MAITNFVMEIKSASSTEEPTKQRNNGQMHTGIVFGLVTVLVFLADSTVADLTSSLSMCAFEVATIAVCALAAAFGISKSALLQKHSPRAVPSDARHNTRGSNAEEVTEIKPISGEQGSTEQGARRRMQMTIALTLLTVLVFLADSTVVDFTSSLPMPLFEIAIIAVCVVAPALWVHLGRCSRCLNDIDAALHSCENSSATPHPAAFRALVDRDEELSRFRLAHFVSEARVAPSVYSFSAVINAWAKAGDVNAACRWLQAMQAAGIAADIEIFSTLFEACITVRDLAQAIHVFEQMRKHGVKLDVETYAALASAFACQDLWQDVEAIAWEVAGDSHLS